MKKRLWIGLVLLLAFITIAVLAVPEYRLTVLGYLRRENLFAGFPTSYWRLKVDTYVSRRENPAAIRRSYWGKLLQFFASTGTPEKPSILRGDIKALPVLIDLIKEKSNRRVSMETYAAIANMGSSARGALPILEEDLNGEDSYFCVVAVQTMLRLGSESVPCLIGALKHDDAQVRASAAYSLGEIGQSAKKSVPSLVEALQDKEEIVRAEAAIALVQIDPKEANKVNAERFIPPRGPFVAQPPRSSATSNKTP
jgi:hypothetical protein